MRSSSIATALTLLVQKRRPAFVWGPPGVGKSDVVAQVAAKLDMELRDVRLNLMDPIDLKGFPVPDHATKSMNWYPPDFLPPMYITKGKKVVPNDTKGILFLDELNSAERSVQAAGYQLLLNFRIGEYVLPPGWSIVAAGNGAKDRSVTHTMPAAMANRLVHLDYETHLEDFSAWALKAGIKSDVLAFLRFRSGLLHSFDPTENPRAFPSPRSWMFVNEIIGEGLPANEEFEVLKGTVGPGAAAEFKAFLDIARQLPSIDQILLHPDKAPVPEQPSALYAVATSLAERATAGNFDRVIAYVNRLPPEYQVVAVRDCVSRGNDEIEKLRSYTQWTVKNADVLL